MTALSANELARYSRHILLDEIGREGQEAICQAKVLVIGAGGLGSPAALYLAAAGVGTIGIADFDKVELHNLQRQILHGTQDVDTPKTRSAKAALERINPGVDVRLHEEGVTIDNVLELFGQYDIVVDGTDNFATRYLNNDAAFFAKKPLVYGSIFKFEGQLSLFDNPRSGPCYRCLFPEPPPPGSVPNCGEAGVIGALCGVIGSLQALETVKYIVGAGESIAGSLLAIDTLGLSHRKLRLAKDPGCPLCGESPAITSLDSERYQQACAPQPPAPSTSPLMDYPLETDVASAHQALQSGQAELVDVREAFELDICQVANARHIPMNTIPQHLDALTKDRPLLIICHHGGRSRQVTRYLRQNGFENAINIAGGINAWANEIDPELQRY